MNVLSPMIRVVVIDDDDLSRRGIAELLGDDGRFVVTDQLNHDDALATTGWESVDIALVDAADTRREDDDMFPGVSVVEHIRSVRNADETTIVVITGHFFEDALRLRMREAKADLFFHRTELQDAQRLRDVLADPTSVQRPVPGLSDPEAAFRLGVVDGTRVNEGVRFARDAGWLAGLSRNGRPSRAESRQRGEFRKRSRLNPVNSDGTPPDRNQQDPSRTQIEKFVEWATHMRR